MHLSEKQGDMILGVVAILGGLVILFLTNIQKLEFIRKGMPGAGMFPILCGIGVSACGGLLIFEILRRKEPEDGENLINPGELRNFLFFIGLGGMILVLSEYLGMLTCLWLSVAAYIKFQGKDTWIKSILVGLGCTIFLYLVFSVFLRIPLPKGPLGF